MVTFTNPLLLVLIPCCIVYFFFFVIDPGHIKRHKPVTNPSQQKKIRTQQPGQIVFAIVRSIIATLLILALAGAKIRTGSDLISTVIAIDVSASMDGTIDEALTFIDNAQNGRSENDIAGVVLFGEKSTIASNLDSETISGTAFGIRVANEFTNIEDVLRFSQTLLREDTQKRITLVSDGLENIGDAATAAKLLNKNGITLDVYHLQTELGAEVQLNEIRVPRSLRLGVRYDIEVRGWSTTENTGRLLVYRNDELIADDQVDIRKGENKFVFSDTVSGESGGGMIYRAEILPVNDVYADNNTVFTYSYADGRPSILVVGNKGSEREIVKILNSTESGLGVTVKSPYELVMNYEELNIYDTVILANISVEDLPEGFIENLESYVRNQGGGLIVSGGDNSYGLGEYENTLLETVLPVEMKLTDEEESPDVGMIIVLDRSGSMTGGNYGISKLEMAKEAVIRSIDALNDTDSIGVLVFDDQFSWAVEYTKAGGNRQSIKNKVAGISPGGGTSILPALTQGFSAIKNADSKVRHIILLTDGQAERYGYEGLIKSMNDTGITLSTIAVGSDSDTELLERLALIGRGRYYFTNEFTDLPKIFTKETKMAGRRYINDEEFFPIIGHANEILSGIFELPALGGYVSTTAKPRADAVLLSERGEPVLAAWQYGLGRSIAWTSDMDGNWSREWLKYETSVTVFRNMISWAVKRRQESQLQLDLVTSGKNADITLKLPYGESIQEVRATVIGSDRVESEIVFKAIAPGTYTGVLADATAGAYMAAITTESETESAVYTEGFCVPYSAELDMRGRERGSDFLYKLAEATGGRILETGDDVFIPMDGAVYNDKNIADLLVILSLLLFLVDIFIRRFPIIRRIPALQQKPANEGTTVIKSHAKPQSTKDISQDNTGNIAASLISQKKKRLNRR